MVLDIVTYGDPRLKEPGARVETFDAELQRFVEAMLETMYRSSGIGLAAQQVGRPQRITVIDMRPREESVQGPGVEQELADPAVPMPLVLVNPELSDFEGEVSAEEGCLSFPELFASVRRPESILVRARDAAGKDFEFRARGLLSRAIQHEVDHLDGKLFIERMDPLTRLRYGPRIRKIQHQTQALLTGVG